MSVFTHIFSPHITNAYWLPYIRFTRNDNDDYQRTAND